MIQVDFKLIDFILEKHECQKTKVIPIMQDIQKEYKFLPKDALMYVADKVGVSPAELYGIATFYENFSMNEKGKYVIKVCNGTACHVRKSIPILERLRNELGLSESKHTTDDLMFTLDTVSCLGACGLAPVLTVNDTVHPSMTPDKASELIAGLRNKED